MNQGMLWYDSRSAKDFYARLDIAVSYFKEKYGFAPQCCFVHPDMLKDIPEAQGGVKIVTDEKVLRNHFWMEFPLAE